MAKTTIGEVASTAVNLATDAIVLTLSDMWLGISAVKPASTEGGGWRDVLSNPAWLPKRGTVGERIESATPQIDRFDTRKLWSIQLGDYFLPLSQSYTLRAKKRLNIASMVDGIDIIQQTRKEAKTIDCSLRLTLRDNQPNLELVKGSQVGQTASYALADTNEAYRAMQTFGEFLQDFYEKDAIFAINNSTINNTFGVSYVFISEYTFRPLVGKGTFQFDFSLTEVAFGDDILTFDINEIGDA